MGKIMAGELVDCRAAARRHMGRNEDHKLMFVPDAHARGRPLQRGLGDVKIAVLRLGYVVGAGHIGPHVYELTVGSEYLDATVLPIANVDQTLFIDQQAVGQVEFSGAALAGNTPGLDQLPIFGKAMYPAVAVAVGYV